MLVCNRCGDQSNNCSDIKIRIFDYDIQKYEFDQNFKVCSMCKPILLDQLSMVISNCKINNPKEKSKTVVKKKVKSKKDK